MSSGRMMKKKTQSPATRSELAGTNNTRQTFSTSAGAHLANTRTKISVPRLVKHSVRKSCNSQLLQLLLTITPFPCLA